MRSHSGSSCKPFICNQPSAFSINNEHACSKLDVIAQMCQSEVRRICNVRTILSELMEVRHELAAHKFRLHHRCKLRQMLRGGPPHLKHTMPLSVL